MNRFAGTTNGWKERKKKLKKNRKIKPVGNCDREEKAFHSLQINMQKRYVSSVCVCVYVYECAF